MVNQELIRSILKTYELPEKLEDKIFNVASRRISELGLQSFDDQYSCISYIIEKFGLNYNTTHLDSLVGDKPLYKMLGVEDPNLNKLLNDDQSVELSDIPLRDILTILKDRMGEKDYLTIFQLIQTLNCLDLNVEIGYRELLTKLSSIQSKLLELSKHVLDGKKLNPIHRPIIDIRFNPLNIQFGHRSYDGNPLAYFKEHYELYKGMSRRKLNEFDHGLYLSLNKAGQLDQAILPRPKKKSHVLLKHVAKLIIKAYQICDGNIAKAARSVGCSTMAVRRYWKLEGLID